MDGFLARGEATTTVFQVLDNLPISSVDISKVIFPDLSEEGVREFLQTNRVGMGRDINNPIVVGQLCFLRKIVSPRIVHGPFSPGRFELTSTLPSRPCFMNATMLVSSADALKVETLANQPRVGNVAEFPEDAGPSDRPRAVVRTKNFHSNKRPRSNSVCVGPTPLATFWIIPSPPMPTGLRAYFAIVLTRLNFAITRRMGAPTSRISRYVPFAAARNRLRPLNAFLTLPSHFIIFCSKVGTVPFPRKGIDLIYRTMVTVTVSKGGYYPTIR